MHAQRFHGDADGPDLLIHRATDGTFLPVCRGWTCDGCGTIFVGRDAAERCCIDQEDGTE